MYIQLYMYTVHVHVGGRKKEIWQTDEVKKKAGEKNVQEG